MAEDGLLGQRRHAGRDLSVDGDIGDADFLNGCNERARFARMAIQESFALEGGDVLHHRGLAGKTEMTLDFACAWGDAFLTLFTLNEIEHASLAIGQHAARWRGLWQRQVQMNMD